jgi:MoxR-like ATPase
MIPSIKDGTENHRMSEAVKTYRDGGVLVFDEFDRLMGGTAVAANMALANTEWSMPDGTVIKRHPDLFILATANTLGQGKGRSPYGAAEVLDGATLNRFAGGVIHWGYDMAFERQLIGDDSIPSFFHDLRSKADKAGLFGRIISPRSMLTAHKQKHILGWDMERIRRVAVADWSAKDLQTIGFEKKFIDLALATNGGAA